MKLTFIGAAHEVTGSCHYVEGANQKFLIDCGMEQGPDLYENKEIPVNLGEIDFVLLTHAHIDHSGNLPLIYAKGFKGPVYATAATCDLCNIMLRDSAHIQTFEAEWQNRKRKRAGNEEFVPAYTMQDALGLINNLVPCKYNEKIELAEGITVRFNDVGHLLGSSAIEVWVQEEKIVKKLVFSGDVGNVNQPLIKDPSYIEEADYVIMESTYGNRNHDQPVDYAIELAKVIQETFDKGGNLVIPSFAVGRTQELLYFLRRIKEEHLVKGYDGFAVYVDSPLAVEATSIFNEHTSDCFDEEAMNLIQKGINPIVFRGLKLSITSEESKAINFDERCKVILSASGMCEAGRIKHHLKHNLWRASSTVLFVGYQALGTLGRALVEGATSVKIFGEEIHVCARICQLPGISGHADQAGLLRFAAAFREKPQKVFVVHGEDEVCGFFADLIKESLGYEAIAPYSGSVFDLAKNEWIHEAEGIAIVKTDNKVVAEGQRYKNTVYGRLVAAGQRLLAVITRNQGGANKDLAKFADQINSLSDKWDR